MPFKSDKQRKYMYANHPEIAKRWSAEYANDGGFFGALSEGWSNLKSHKGSSDMVKRNRLSAQYQRARNEGLIPEGVKFDEWLSSPQGQQASANTTGEAVQTVGETMEMLPVLGDVRAMENAWDAVQAGDYSKAAAEVGFTALGYVPFAGIAAKAGKSIRKLKGAKKVAALQKYGLTPDQIKMAQQSDEVMDAMIGDALHSGKATVDDFVAEGLIKPEYADGAKQSIADLQRFEEVTGVRPNYTSDGWSAGTMIMDEASEMHPYGTIPNNVNVPAPIDPHRQFVVDHELGHLNTPYGTQTVLNPDTATLGTEAAANRYAVNRGLERGGIRPDLQEEQMMDSLNESYGSYINTQDIVEDADGIDIVDMVETPEGLAIQSAGEIPEELNVMPILQDKTAPVIFPDENQEMWKEVLHPTTRQQVDKYGSKVGELQQTQTLHPDDFITGGERYGEGDLGPAGYDNFMFGAEGPQPANFQGSARVGEYTQPAPLAEKTGQVTSGYNRARRGTPKKNQPARKLSKEEIAKRRQAMIDAGLIKTDAAPAPAPKTASPATSNLGKTGKIEYGGNNWDYVQAKHPHNAVGQTFNMDVRAPLEAPLEATTSPVKLAGGIEAPTKRLSKSNPNQTRYEKALSKTFDNISNADGHAFARSILDYPEIFPQNEFGATNFKRMQEAVKNNQGLEIGSPLKVGSHSKGHPGYNARVTFLGADGQDYSVPISVTQSNAEKATDTPVFKLANTRLGRGKNKNEFDLGAERFNRGGRLGPLSNMKGGM